MAMRNVRVGWASTLRRHDYQRGIRKNHFPNTPICAFLTAMNAAQQDVLDKVIELLSEHFDHSIVAVGWYDEDKQYSTTATYSGGVAPALGLCKLYETKWQKEHLWGADED